jgi:hypothetical protein
MDIIGRLLEDSPLFLTREQFEKSLEGWSVEPVEREGTVIGCYLIKGPELHFSKFDDAPVGRVHLQRLASLIAEHGHATTRTPLDDQRMLRFNQRIGFYETGRDQYDAHLRIDHLRAKE